MSAGIGCRDLRVHARDRVLLHVDALDVPAGSTLAVLGPNGAGKSTLLRALGLLLPPRRVTGEVRLDGRPATAPRMRAAVAAVLQRPILRRGTVAANVASGLRLRGVGRREALDGAAPWLDALGVAHLAARDARTLSGGEAQRVSVARALAVGPRVLLLDEPFAALDAATRADLLADLRAALDGRPTATVLVTHDRHEARALAGHTALLVGGRLRRHGPTAEVLDRPVDVDTARLLGFTNLLPPGGDGPRRAARPEDCRVAAGPGVDGVRGTVRRVVALGDVTRIDVDTPSGPLTCLHPGAMAGEARVGGEVHVVASAARPLDGCPESRVGAASGHRTDT
ncbi:MAG: ATP-binding cassette domain-containing protein [Pseudonocardia sp.]|nr:ATP-binding cassette domain-containing protein [Pseudonocardia sp.]